MASGVPRPIDRAILIGHRNPISRLTGISADADLRSGRAVHATLEGISARILRGPAHGVARSKNSKAGRDIYDYGSQDADPDKYVRHVEAERVPISVNPAVDLKV